MIAWIIIVGIGVASILYFFVGIKIINEWDEALVFKFGKYSGNIESGFRWVEPISTTIKRVDKRIRTIDVKPQKCLTKDSIPVNIDAVIYYKVNDTKKAILGAENYHESSCKLGQTALRDVVGKQDLSALLQEKDSIGSQIQRTIQEPTNKWGVEITNVEIKNVSLPEDMERAMAKEAEAQREKKARIIKAEGELEASKKLKEAADTLDSKSMILRQLQTWQEIGIEQNTMIVLVPNELIGKITS